MEVSQALALKAYELDEIMQIRKRLERIISGSGKEVDFNLSKNPSLLILFSDIKSCQMFGN